MGRIYEYDFVTEQNQSQIKKTISLPENYKYVTHLALLKYADNPSQSISSKITITQNSKIILNKVLENFLFLNTDFNGLEYWLPVNLLAQKNTLELLFDTNGGEYNQNEKFRLFLYCDDVPGKNFYYHSESFMVHLEDNGFKEFEINIPKNKSFFALGILANTYKFDISIIKDNAIFLKKINGEILKYSNKAPFTQRLFGRNLHINKFYIQLSTTFTYPNAATGNYKILIVLKDVFKQNKFKPNDLPKRRK